MANLVRFFTDPRHLLPGKQKGMWKSEGNSRRIFGDASVGRMGLHGSDGKMACRVRKSRKNICIPMGDYSEDWERMGRGRRGERWRKRQEARREVREQARNIDAKPQCEDQVNRGKNDPFQTPQRVVLDKSREPQAS